MRSTSLSNQATDAQSAATSSSSKLPALAAVALGLFIIGMAGFAPGFVHGAAHDARHSLVYPCH
jgi:cobalt transporter subunit CbtB